MFFFNCFFKSTDEFYLQVLLQAYASPRKPTKANEGQRRPTKAHKGPCEPNEDPRRPTQANEGQRKANAGPQRPTQANAALQVHDGQRRSTALRVSCIPYPTQFISETCITECQGGE